MSIASLRIGLASPRMPHSREEALATTERFLAEAASQAVAIVCFPETYLPGYRSPDFQIAAPDQAAQEAALQQVCALARNYAVAVIMPMEWASPAGLRNVAYVINADGTIQGCQAKTQIALEEDPYYVHGDTREMFAINGVPFGVAICHEAFRYPETVRWAARRGAKVVFHPHLTGTNHAGNVPRFWGDPEGEYYEKAMIARAVENVIYFASVNFAFQYQETATSLISPTGKCLAYTPYGEEALLVADLDLAAATGWGAQRFAPARYPAE